MGDKFLIMKDHNSAVKCYSFAIEISPTVTMTHYKLGVALQVFVLLYSFLLVLPEQKLIIFFYPFFLQRGYNIKEAIQSFQNVLNRDPNFEDGKLLTALNMYKKHPLITFINL